MLAYDYDAQKWIDGAEGTRVRIQQLRDEIDVLSGAEAAEYVRVMERRGAMDGFTVEDALAATREQLAVAEAEAERDLPTTTIDRCPKCAALATAAPRLPNGRKRMVLCEHHGGTDAVEVEK